MSCPDEGELLAFATGGAASAGAAGIEQHIDACSSCFEVIAQLSAAPSPSELDALHRRYDIGRVLGAGAMSTVYEAHDRILERKVALKVLREDLPRTEHRRLRLLREAQSLARIRHPNVVAIYDAGELGPEVYLAMELVDGESLATHLARRTDDWRAIVELFEAAGRGLVAAHRAGIVHRDFKPSNVLIERSGRVIVTDFGLAAFAEDATFESTPHGSDSQTTLLAHALSSTRARLGTPGYMAPEQFLGRPATAQSDQFAFCVALVEALAGGRPFAGDSVEAWLASQRRGPDPEVLARLRGPRSLASALSRGLAFDPERRHASMLALLDRLRRCRTVARRRLITGLCTGAAAAALLVVWSENRPPAACEAPLGRAWDAERRQAIAERLIPASSSEPAEANRPWQRIEAYADELATTYAEVCSVLPRDVDDASLGRRAQWGCLQQRRGALEAFSDAVVEAPPEQIGTLVSALDRLSSIFDCRSPAAALRVAPLPDDPELGQRVIDLRSALALAAVRQDVGDPTAVEALERLLAESVDLGFEPLRAEIGVVLGWAYIHADDIAAANDRFSRAYELAMHNGHEPVAAAATRGVIMTLRHDGRFSEARAWAEAAVPLHDQPWERVMLNGTRGAVAILAADLPEAALYLDAARAGLLGCGRCEGGPANLAAFVENHYAQLLTEIGDYERSIAHYERDLELTRDGVGPQHVAVAERLVAVAEAERLAGHPERARARLEQAIAMVDTIGGKLPGAWANLGALQAASGDHVAALASWGRARASGPAGLFVAAIDVDRARSLRALGRADEADQLCTTAIETFSASLGVEHPGTHDARRRCGVGGSDGDRTTP